VPRQQLANYRARARGLASPRESFLYSASDHTRAPPTTSSDDLAGLSVLLVEDSPTIAEAVKQLLELLGACVTGPAATIAEAESLLAQKLPDVALLDFHLRGGERSDGLIAGLRQRNVPVILLTGSIESPTPLTLMGATILEKPVSEAQLLAHLGPIATGKLGR
jgi:CheY-like chemotaxis protein